MAGPVRIAILADAKPAVAGIRQVEGAASGMGSKLGGIGKGIAGAFAGLGALFAVDKIAEGFKQTIDQAASLQAAIGSTKQIFGSSANDMLNWSKGAATSLGLSQAEALNATKTFGGFFTAVGMNAKQADTMSKSWATMAGNLAAFGDMPTSDAIEAVTAALRGELDPLQKYIPTISAASIQQKAMAMSGKKNAAALTNQDKAAAINAIMMDSVANKAGAAERAQGGYAVQMDKLKAQMKDGAAAIGSVFLPALTGGMRFINSTAIPALKNFGQWIGPKLKGFASGVGGVLSGIGGFKPPKAIVNLATSKQAMSIVGSVQSGLGSVVGVIKTGFGSLGPVLSKAMAVIAPIVKTVADTLSNAFTKALPQIKAILGSIGGIISDVFAAAGAIIKTTFDNVKTVIMAAVTVIQFLWQAFGSNILGYISGAFGGIVTVIQGAFTIIKGIFDVIVGLLTGDWSKAWDGVKGIVLGAWQIIQGVFAVMKAEITLVVGVIGKILGAGWALIASAAVAAWNWIKGVVVGAWNGIKAGVSAAANFLKGLVVGVWNAIKAATSTVWGWVMAFINAEWTGIKIIVGAAVAFVKSVISTAWSAIQSATSAIWNGIKAVISTVWNGIKSVVSGAVSAIRSAISGAWSAVQSATSTAWNAIKGAVSAGIGNVVNAVKSLPGKVKGAVSGAAGWLYNTGIDMIQGLINGISNMAGAVAKKARDVVLGAFHAAQNALLSHSPSMLFHALGVDSVQGYINGMSTKASDITKTINTMISDVTKAFPKAIKQKWPKGTKQSIIDKWNKQEAKAAKNRAGKKDQLVAMIGKTNTALQKKIVARDAIAEKLKEANDNIVELQKQRADVVSGIGDAFVGTFQIINDSADEGIASIDDILQRSRDAVAQAKDFADQITTLATKGVDPKILQDLAQAGPKAGLDTAKALASASADQIKELNDNYKAIASSGQAAGEAVAGNMYDAGIAAAQAIADGFASQQAAMEASIMAIINRLATLVQQAITAATSPLYVAPVPKLTPVKTPVKKVTTPAKKPTVKATAVATKAVPATVKTTPVAVTVNTGVVVDKRGLVDTISAAFNEVSDALGRPISMNVR